MHLPHLKLVSRLEGDCEKAVLRVVKAAARHLKHPDQSTLPVLTAYREHLLNQCDRLCALLLQFPDHRRYRTRYRGDFECFLSEWADLFTDPADFPSLRALLRAWDTSEVDPVSAPPRASRRKQLHALLVELFDEGELRRWLGQDDALAPLQSVLSTGGSLDQIVDELIGAAGRHGLLGPPFFAALEQERPERAAEIARVRALG